MVKHSLSSIKKSRSEKFYVLVEFPYPSGDLHMGHWYAFVPADVYARFMRMQGREVLFPIGFDAFGLPAENAAIQRGIHPRDWTYDNIKRMTKQFESMGPSFDWDRMVITSDPDYYRWTQWLFLKMFEAGLAYRANVPANWCPKCQTVLANEQVENGKCWRHGDTEVIQKEIEQWLFKITDYAEKLMWPDSAKASSGKIDWPKLVIEGQNNWIGKSEGTLIQFSIFNFQFSIEVFTTRPDTLFGATFLVLAPEHPFVAELLKVKTQSAKLKTDIQAYIKQSQKKSARERQVLEREKTGVFTGLYAINPANNEEIPVWIADFVIGTYGTGAIMAVPAHDQRDFEFAKKYGLPIKEVVVKNTSDGDPERSRRDSSEVKLGKAYEGEGTLINSGPWNGLHWPGDKEKILSDIEKKGFGKRKIQYHLHDWTISRQRYWGAPIPMVHCPKCGVVPVPEKDLPVELPYKVDYTPRGKSPLASAREWVEVTCPECGSAARRDTDTMDTFVDSSWYFFRYVSPLYKKAFADPEQIKRWMPVDIYFGGGEHTLGHTLYARFITRVLHDLGYIPFDEFASRRVHHGIILGPDNQKMSKSRGNVINPDQEVKKYGADTVRMYLMFMGPMEAGGPWDPKGITGVHRFLNKVRELVTEYRDLVLTDTNDTKDVLISQHKTIKRVTEDLENLKFNTAIAALMEYVNLLRNKAIGIGQEKLVPKIRCAEWDSAIETLLLLLAPFAPQITEELWGRFNRKSIHLEPWPSYNPELIKDEEVTIAVQVNGKLRDTIKVQSLSKIDPSGAKFKVWQSQTLRVQSEVEALAKESAKVSRYIEGKATKVIFVPGKLINFVTEN